MNPQEVAARWAAVRSGTGLSRQAFAERTGLTPGAIWRIEKKGVFKPGEVEKLETALADGLDTGKVIKSARLAPPAVIEPEAEDLESLILLADLQSTLGAPAPFTLERLSPRQLTEKDGIDRFANSELGTFNDCERRWWLSFYRGLGPKIEPQTGVREIGNRVHAALEAWYASDPAKRVDPRDALERILASDWAAVQAAVTDADLPPLSLETSFKREADLQRAMVAGYVQWLADTGVDSDLRVIEPEAYLEADLPEVEAKLIAKIDVRVLRESDGARLWLEHKTVGGFQQKLATITLDEQVLHQTLVERLQPDDGPRVVGVLYNMLKRSKRGQTAKPPFFQRVEVHHNQHELDSFRRRVVTKITRLRGVRAALDDGADHRDVVVPRPSGDCSWKCPFVQVCPMFDDGSRAEAALSQYFIQGDPSGYYLKKEVISDPTE